MDFLQVEAEFQRLKAQFEAGTLTEEEFKSQLEELMIQDENGKWWIIGYETGQWYYHDGERWMQSEPPKPTPVPPPTSVVELQRVRKLFQERGFLSSILLTAIGGAISWAIGLGTIGMVIGRFIGGAVGGAIGGLITGLALRRAEPSIQWQQVLIVTIVWAIGWAIGGAIALVSNWLPIGGAIGGAIGGGVTLWQLSRARHRA